MRFVIAAALLMLTHSAWAEWVKYSETNAATFYYDPTTLERKGGARSVWTLVEFAQPQRRGERSMRSHTEVGCAEKRFRHLAMSGHTGSMAGGKVVGTNKRTSPWQPIAAGTAAAHLLEAVCGR